MVDVSGFETPFFVSSVVLLLMCCLALVLALSSHFKFRALQRSNRNLSVTIFNRIFNVFDPYPRRRKAIHSCISILPIIVMFASFVLTFVLTVKILETGFALGLIVLIICLGLTIFDETFEVFQNANIFAKAVSEGAGLGEGDLDVFFLLEKTLPKLRTYYFSLATVFFAFSVALPFVMSVLFLAGLQLLGAVFAAFAFSNLAPFLIIFVFAAITVTVQIIVKKIKNKIIGFPSSESLVLAVKGTCRMPTE